MGKAVELVTGEYYHIYNKSIAGYQIFNNDREFRRILGVLRYYQYHNSLFSFAQFVRLASVENSPLEQVLIPLQDEKNKLVSVAAYCVMPTHLHLILKQQKDRGISIYMNNILNSYTRYFNTRHKRKGPLWVARFGRRLVDSDAYLLHLTRYLHLNPTTAGLSKKPEQWPYSSYKEYLGLVDSENSLCEYEEVLEISPTEYKEFVNDRISYQKELAEIKHLLFE